MAERFDRFHEHLRFPDDFVARVARHLGPRTSPDAPDRVVRESPTGEPVENRAAETVFLHRGVSIAAHWISARTFVHRLRPATSPSKREARPRTLVDFPLR